MEREVWLTNPVLCTVTSAANITQCAASCALNEHAAGHRDTLCAAGSVLQNALTY